MKHGSLFSGIGGFDLAAEWMGWENVFHCEWNEFGQKVLKHYWPNAISYGDITKTDFTIHRGRIDILTGGFPCQPYSMAGKRLGKEDERHLWPQMLRAIREIQPRWIVGENVSGIISWNGGLVFNEVQTDLEAEGYEVQPFVLPACAVNAPHRRDRVWFVAHSNVSRERRDEREKKDENNVDPHRKDDRRERSSWRGKNWREGGAVQETGECGSKFVGSCKDASNDSNSGNENLQERENGIYKPEHAANTDINIRGREERELLREQEQRRHLQEVPGVTQVRNVTNSKKAECESAGGTRTGMDGFADVCEQIVTNPDGSVGCEGGMHQTRPEETTRHAGSCDTRSNERPNWDNFPTVSPICSRDDGFSYGLVDITFSKWRNEGIKALGNAIVPVLVLQIFKAIEQYELQGVQI